MEKQSLPRKVFEKQQLPWKSIEKQQIPWKVIGSCRILEKINSLFLEKVVSLEQINDTTVFSNIFQGNGYSSRILKGNDCFLQGLFKATTVLQWLFKQTTVLSKHFQAWKSTLTIPEFPVTVYEPFEIRGLAAWSDMTHDFYLLFNISGKL